MPCGHAQLNWLSVRVEKCPTTEKLSTLAWSVPLLVVLVGVGTRESYNIRKFVRLPGVNYDKWHCTGCAYVLSLMLGMNSN